MSHHFHFYNIEFFLSNVTNIKFYMFIICYFKFWWKIVETNDLNDRFDWFYFDVDQNEWLKLTIWLISNKQIELKISKFLVCSFRNSDSNSLFMFYRNLVEFSKYKISKIFKKSIINSIELNFITFYFRFFRKFQNWFYIFNMSNIRRETTSISMFYRNLIEFSKYKNWKIRKKSDANSIET